MTATILVAEDSLVIRAVLRRYLEDEGYSVVEAVDGQAALAQCQQSRPDVILLDIEMPGINGHQVLAHLKADDDLKDIPVVFLTGKTDTADIVAGLRGGAHDYLKKPFETPELIARVGAAMRTKNLQDQLRDRSAQFDQMSRTDALTGLYNRRHLEERLRQINSAAVRHSRALALIMIDIDHFKQVNDIEGHQGGDTILQEFSRRLRRQVRDEDVVGRWGGEEFLVVLAETDTAGVSAFALAERIRHAVEGDPFEYGDHQVAVTVSAGYACGAAGDTDDLLRRADAALYVSKANGRNRTTAAPPDTTVNAPQPAQS
jgi:diguanylate cyclase (GGDEF)-like protein